MAHVTACEVMRLQWIAPNIYTGLYRGDPIIDDQSDRYFAQSHSDHLTETYWRICYSCPEPKTEKIKKNNRQHERKQRQRRDADKIKRFHIAAKTIGSETARKGLIGRRDAALRCRWDDYRHN